MIQPNDNSNEPQTRARGQEVIFYNNNDVEAVNPNPTITSDNIDESKNNVDAAPTNIKRGYFPKNPAYVGFGILCVVAVIGIAAGVGIAGTNTANQANLQFQSEKMVARNPHRGSGKSGKSQADFYQCIVEPFVSFRSIESLPETPTKKEFAENVWNPYIKKCGGFWFNIAYLLTRLVLYFIEQVFYFIAYVEYMLGMNMIPSECTDLLPSLDPSNMFVSSILETEGDTMSFIEGVGDCVEVIYDLVLDRCVG